jgi:hypothetical protein
MEAVGNDERSSSITREIVTSPSFIGGVIRHSFARRGLVIG